MGLLFNISPLLNFNLFFSLFSTSTTRFRHCNERLLLLLLFLCRIRCRHLSQQLICNSASVLCDSGVKADVLLRYESNAARSQRTASCLLRSISSLLLPLCPNTQRICMDLPFASLTYPRLARLPRHFQSCHSISWPELACCLWICFHVLRL